MRKATFAGQFYPASQAALDKALEQAFLGERGPGSLPPRKHDRHVLAAIVPHAGYDFSGQAAAWAYHAIAATETPDLFIILAPNHHSAESGTTTEPVETPLGMVRVDQAFVRGLVEKGTIGLDDQIMPAEHSVEVQLPFLQFILKDGLEKLKIAPLLISADIDLKQLALDIKETLVEQNKKAIFIVSSDFTHHGPQYHYQRFNQDAAAKIYDLDAQMIELIKERNAAEFAEFVDKEMATVCGALPIQLLLMLLKPCEAKLEQYYTSGDVLDDYKNSVSYAAIVFEQP